MQTLFPLVFKTDCARVLYLSNSSFNWNNSCWYSCSGPKVDTDSSGMEGTSMAIHTPSVARVVQSNYLYG